VIQGKTCGIQCILVAVVDLAEAPFSRRIFSKIHYRQLVDLEQPTAHDI
jgi:hypothetical protein